MTELATHFRGHGGVKEVMTELAADFGGHQKMHICSREAVVVKKTGQKHLEYSLFSKL